MTLQNYRSADPDSPQEVDEEIESDLGPDDEDLDDEIDDDFDEETEFEHDDWPGVWQDVRIYTQADGSVIAEISTNDDNDDGLPDPEVVRWNMQYGSVEKSLEHLGKSRVGVSGVAVTVFLDGKKI